MTMKFKDENVQQQYNAFKKERRHVYIMYVRKIEYEMIGNFASCFRTVLIQMWEITRGVEKKNQKG